MRLLYNLFGSYSPSLSNSPFCVFFKKKSSPICVVQIFLNISLPYSVIQYQKTHPWRKSTLPLPAAIKCQQLLSEGVTDTHLTTLNADNHDPSSYRLLNQTTLPSMVLSHWSGLKSNQRAVGYSLNTHEHILRGQSLLQLPGFTEWWLFFLSVACIAPSDTSES